MGLSYLNGKSWSQVTRQERYFCYRLFEQLERPNGVKTFLGLANAKGNLAIPVDASWEPAVEACLYRDLCHLRGKIEEPHSGHRAFDLCLLGEQHIVVIEAKAQQEFDDPEQIEDLKADRDAVRNCTGVSEVTLLAIASSRCPFPPEISSIFDGILRWNELAQAFGCDTHLLRADEIFEESAKCRNKNADGK